MENGRYVDLAPQIDITDAALASSLVPVQCASLAPPAKIQKDPYDSKGYTHTHTPPRREANFKRRAGGLGETNGTGGAHGRSGTLSKVAGVGR